LAAFGIMLVDTCAPIRDDAEYYYTTPYYSTVQVFTVRTQNKKEEKRHMRSSMARQIGGRGFDLHFPALIKEIFYGENVTPGLTASIAMLRIGGFNRLARNFLTIESTVRLQLYNHQQQPAAAEATAEISKQRKKKEDGGRE